MNQIELQQKIAEYYQKLPQEAQEIFSSMQWLEKLKEISTKYGLNDQQIETLGTETTLVLLGIIHTDEYESILKNEIKISEESTKNMLVEINDSVSEIIRPQLEEAFYQNDREETEKLDERFNNLSKETKDAIEKSDYQTKIYEIGQKHNLTVYQMGILGESTISVMLGITLPNKFEESLKELQLPTEKITEIVNDVNDQILKKIREELVKNINRGKISEKEIEKQPLEIESREEMLKKIENPESIKPITNYELRIEKKDKEDAITNEKNQSILGQKLSGTFQTPKTETNHSLSNINKIDPYREPTE